MATLQKFKLLATQCAVAGSPTRSPSASPVIHLRRRKTLRMFLSRTDRRRFTSRSNSDPPVINGDDEDDDDDRPQKSKEVAKVRHKLKDLFVSSPPLEDRGSDRSRGIEQEEERGLLSATGSVGGVGSGGFASRRGAGMSLRPLAASFRCRLLKRAWRPVLVTIPE